MTDHDALYRAILAHPADDTPRLVYADWLQEHDRAEEAEFIRLGCRLDSNSPDHPDYPEWTLRQQELQLWLATHVPGPTPKFSAGLSLDGGSRWWSSTLRGFPRYLEFEGTNRSGLKPIRQLAAALEKAFTRIPTRWLVVRWLTVAQLAELLRQPVMEQVDTLTVQFYQSSAPDDEAALVLANSPRLRNLRGMSLAIQAGEAGLTALAQSEHLNRVEWFSFPGPGITPGGIRALGTAPWFRNLRSLRLNGLQHNGLPDASFTELCGLGPFPRLHTLDLMENDFVLATWEAFARSKAFPALARLSLNRTHLHMGRALALLGAPWLRLAALDLGGCSIDNDGAVALAKSPMTESLRWLRLWLNGISGSGATAICGCKKLTGLKYLDVGNNHLGAGGLRALAKNRALRDLIELDLDGSTFKTARLPSAALHELLSNLDMPQLRHLSLRWQPLGSRGARLLTGEKFASLTRLNLGSCQLTPAAVAALLTAPALQNLIELRLDENKLSGGVEPLLNRRTMPRLASCNLSGNRIEDELAKKLARRPGVIV